MAQFSIHAYDFDLFGTSLELETTRYSLAGYNNFFMVTFVGTNFTYDDQNFDLNGGTITAIEFAYRPGFSGLEGLIQRIDMPAGGVAASNLFNSLIAPAASLNNQLLGFGYRLNNTFISDFEGDIGPGSLNFFTPTQIKIRDFANEFDYVINGSGFSLANGSFSGTVSSITKSTLAGSVINSATGVAGMSLNTALLAFGNGRALYSALVQGNNTLTATEVVSIFDPVVRTTYAGVASVMDGGPGADSYIGTAGNRDIVEYRLGISSGVIANLTTGKASGGGGADTFSQIDGIIGTPFNDTLTGDSLDNLLAGGDGDDTLSGLNGADVLYGGAGINTMIGGNGNDTYIVIGAGDTVSETSSAGGIDEVLTTISYTLTAHVENMSLGVGLLQGLQIDGFGNGLDNRIFGSTGKNTLSGAGGNDALYGGRGDDTINGGPGNDNIYLEAGADKIDGGDGIDILRYDQTDDDFSVDSLTISLVAPQANVGDDVVGDTYVNIEGILGGRGFDKFTGDGSSNYLYGRDGADSLYGGGGDDYLYGGNNSVDGSGDLIDGGDGFDYARYEDANYGPLRISLRAPETNTGAAAGDTYVSIEGIVGSLGNDLVYGNDGNNSLYGHNGNDTIYGGLGADLHVGGAGIDYARYDDANYGNLVITLQTPQFNTGAAAGDRYRDIEGVIAGAGNDRVDGNTFVNYLYGAGGDDTILGLTGSDTLSGGAGRDKFVFNTALDAATNVDKILDFNVADDIIWVDQTYFTGLAVGALAAGAFATGAAAAEADDRIIYNPATGALIFDSNGSASGGDTRFATLSTGLALTAADFQVIA